MGSQIGQDILVDKILKNKRNGYFLDIGGSFYEDMNNTFFFEKERNWKGIAVELLDIYQEGWLANRKNTIFILGDAVKVDYQKVLDENQFPKIIDFLSVDIDPNTATFDALKKVMETDYQFNVIAFETDYGGDLQYPDRFSVRDPSRALLSAKGYVLVKEIYIGNYHVDDLWVHKSIYDHSIEL
ncbi:hypothetical protein EBU94_02845 [bacterium]|nr:hypothetical protein [bacterium]